MADHNFTSTAVTPTTVDRDDFRSRLRIELHDEDSGNYRWTDATLNQHISRAVAELSKVAPKERLNTLSTVAGSREIEIGALADLVRIEAVEWPVGEHPACFVPWSVYQTTLTLLTEEVPSAVEDLRVFWGGVHVVDASQSTLPTQLEDVMLTGAAAYASLEWASFAINRANVAGPEAARDYKAWGDERLATFLEQLRKLDTASRLRAARLFTADRESTNNNVVRWEP